MGTRIGGVSRPQHVRSNHAADGWVVSYASIKSRLALDEMSSHSDTDSASSRLAVVIPALNERENLDLLIPAVRKWWRPSVSLSKFWWWTGVLLMGLLKL